MSQNPSKFYLTTPIYYVNARPHIGHAYTTIVADVLARRHRLQGEDTFFLTGTDEHGQKIERSAAAAGVAPQQFADQVSAQFRALWDRMGLTYDRYIRTTDECHIRGVQKLFTELYDRGFIYLDSYTGAYCVSDEAFVDLPVGTPCPDCGKALELVTEENFFFKLSEFQLPLLNLIESNELVIEPTTARNEVLSFLRGNVRGGEASFSSPPEAEKAGASAPGLLTTTAATPFTPGALKDLSISRSSFTWGIPVPEAVQQASGTKQKHVIYVWLDALANYMTAVGYGSDKAEEQAEFQKYWPADLHLVGKEITRFHCVYWPAFLLAAGLPLPKKITANGWLLFDNAKMSKSRGNVVRTETILEAFGEHVYAKQFPESTQRERDLFAADVLRYFLLREIPFGQDGSFSFDAMVTRYNADLANGYGNLVSRTCKMIAQYLNGEIPPLVSAPADTDQAGKPVSAPERDSVHKAIGTIRFLSRAVEEGFEDFAFATNTIQSLIAAIDELLTLSKPWKIDQTIQSGRDEVQRILYTAAESIRIITVLLHPFMPFGTQLVSNQLGLDPGELTTYNRGPRTEWGGIKPGTKLGPLAPIFPRADKSLIEIMTNMEDQSTTASPESPLKSATTPAPSTPEPTNSFGPGAAPTDSSAQITIDDFAKVELRIAQVLVAERIPKADKLLRLEVDLGYEKRQILSGIAEWYAPEDLLGRRIIVITNLAPRKMRGLESHGMLLAASEEGGKPFLATVPEGVPLGTRLK